MSRKFHFTCRRTSISQFMRDFYCWEHSPWNIAIVIYYYIKQLLTCNSNKNTADKSHEESHEDHHKLSFCQRVESHLNGAKQRNNVSRCKVNSTKIHHKTKVIYVRTIPCLLQTFLVCYSIYFTWIWYSNSHLGLENNNRNDRLVITGYHITHNAFKTCLLHRKTAHYL